MNEQAFRERGRGRGEEATFPGENSSPGLTEKKFLKTNTNLYLQRCHHIHLAPPIYMSSCLGTPHIQSTMTKKHQWLDNYADLIFGLFTD